MNPLAALMADPESVTFKAIMNPGAVLDPNGAGWSFDPRAARLFNALYASM